jgi:hypothetical protein
MLYDHKLTKITYITLLYMINKLINTILQRD